MARIKVKVKMDDLEKGRFIREVRAEAKRKLPAFLKKIIINQNILKGTSPVKGGGRFKKYSKSYMDQIRGNAAFRTNKQGKVYAIKKEFNITELKSLRASKGALKQARKINKRNKFLAKELNKNLSMFSKRVRPVNFKVSGKALASWFSATTSTGIRIGFSSELARYFHFGNPKNGQPQRWLLPIKSGQVFNRKIEKRLRDNMNIILRKVLRRRSRS